MVGLHCGMHFGVSGQHRGVLEQVGLRLRRVRDLDARAQVL